MGRQADPHIWWGPSEIAERLGLNALSVVRDWRWRHDDFPEPVAKLKMALIWYWPDVEGWAQATGRIEVARTRVEARVGSPTRPGSVVGPHAITSMICPNDMLGWCDGTW